MPKTWIGSSKKIRYCETSGLIFDFTDKVSVFDRGPVPITFPELGKVRCSISTHLFTFLQSEGYKTNFISQINPTEMLVQEFDVPEKNLFFEKTNGRLLPLEFLFRFKITKKFLGRINVGSIDSARLRKLLNGNPPEVGGEMMPPFMECSTKHQDADAYVLDVDAATLARIKPSEIHCIYQDLSAVAQTLRKIFDDAGFDLADGKFEGAITDSGEFVIADSITPDELRLIGPDGESYDKDPIRKWYEVEHPDWVKELLDAKVKYPNDNTQWPDYPAAPSEHIVKETVARYKKVAKAIGAM